MWLPPDTRALGRTPCCTGQPSRPPTLRTSSTSTRRSFAPVTRWGGSASRATTSARSSTSTGSLELGRRHLTASCPALHEECGPDRAFEEDPERDHLDHGGDRVDAGEGDRDRG